MTNDERAELVALDAVRILNYVNGTPGQRINPYETYKVALDVLESPSQEGKTAIQAIWEARKPSVEPYLQAGDDSAYTGLMETLIYAEGMPAGLKENRQYVEEVLRLSSYARTRKPEGAPEFDNARELMGIVELRDMSGVELDPSVSQYTGVLLDELKNTVRKGAFENMPVTKDFVV